MSSPFDVWLFRIPHSAFPPPPARDSRQRTESVKGVPRELQYEEHHEPRGREHRAGRQKAPGRHHPGPTRPQSRKELRLSLTIAARSAANSASHPSSHFPVEAFGELDFR